MSPTIIVVTFNRLHSLKRLLKSLISANYYGFNPVNLIISIDGGGAQDILEYSNDFYWPFGKKEVIFSSINLGLRSHIIKCGDLSNDKGDIIVLEDDCIVGPEYYQFATDALNFYRHSEKIAGISLYSYMINEYAQAPFFPVYDQFDNYFMQVPSSWGQAWTREQWQKFRKYYNSKPIIGASDRLPEDVKNWPESSWKKYFYKYLVEADHYIVYPIQSHTSNFSEIGSHYNYVTTQLQVPLRLISSNYKFSNLKESINVFDAYFEISPISLLKMGVEIDENVGVDFYGIKQLNLFSYNIIITTRPSRSVIKSFDSRMFPLFLNIIFKLEGKGINISSVNDVLVHNLETKRLLIKNTQFLGYWLGFKDGYQDGIKVVKKSNSFRVGNILILPMSRMASSFSNLFKTRRS